MFGVGMLLDMRAAAARKDHEDRRLGWRKVNPHASCEHVRHTSNAIGVTFTVAAATYPGDRVGLLDLRESMAKLRE